MDRPPELVGRDREVTSILDRLRAGIRTVIVGEAGAGKSALAREIGDRLHAQGRPTLFVAGGRRPAGLPASGADVPKAGLAVIVDDVHLLDGPVARAVARLLGQVRGRIVATARSGDKPLHSLGWLWAAVACERMELTPLGAPAVRLLLEQQLDGAIDDALVRVLTERSRGNPLLLQHLTHSAVLSGALADAAYTAAYTAAHSSHDARDYTAVGRHVARATELHSRCERAFIPWAIGRAANDLTTRERHVALLAAAGHADRQISAQLGISIRTVQTHLTRVYAKLHVPGRGELPAALLTDLVPPRSAPNFKTKSHRPDGASPGVTRPVS